MALGTETRAGAGTQKLYDALGDQTDGAPNNRLLKTTVAGLVPLENNLVPTRYLPSYVDDVVEYAQLSAFPVTGEAGKIYVALNTNKQYRYSGSGYALLSDSGLTADQLASFPAGVSATNKLATAADGRFGATTGANPAAPISALPVPGWALQQAGNVLSLLRDAAKISPPRGMVGFAISQGAYVNTSGLNVTASPFIEAEAGLAITFNKPVASVTFYDASKALLTTVGTVSQSTTPPTNTRYFNFVAKTDDGSDSARIGVSTIYSEVYYQVGRLPYLVGLQTSAGVIYPNAKGIVDISTQGGGATGTVKTVNSVAPDAAGNVLLPQLDIYIDATGPIGTAVRAGSYPNGELQGAQPDGSQAGMKFKYGQAKYEFMRGDAGTLVWVRSPVG